MGSERVNDQTGWGLIDLKKAVLGPGQFLGPFRVNMPAGFKDAWSNDISDTAIRERAETQVKAADEWAKRRAALGLVRLIPRMTRSRQRIKRSKRKKFKNIMIHTTNLSTS